MKVIYTNSPQAPKPDEVYRLLNQFFGVVSGATSVFVDGDAPQIEQAYRAAGVAVVSAAGVGTVSFAQVDAKALDDMTVDELQAYLTDHGVEFDAKAKKADLLKLAKEQ